MFDRRSTKNARGRRRFLPGRADISLEKRAALSGDLFALYDDLPGGPTAVQPAAPTTAKTTDDLPSTPLTDDLINPYLNIPGVGLVGPDGNVVGPSIDFNPNDAIDSLPPPNPYPNLNPDDPFPPLLPSMPPLIESGPQMDPATDDRPVGDPGRLLNPVGTTSPVLLPLPPEYEFSPNFGSGGDWGDEWLDGTGGGESWIPEDTTTPMDAILLGYPSSEDFDAAQKAIHQEWLNGSGGGETWPLPVSD